MYIRLEGDVEILPAAMEDFGVMAPGLSMIQLSRCERIGNDLTAVSLRRFRSEDTVAEVTELSEQQGTAHRLQELEP